MKKAVSWHLLNFSELSVDALYAILNLRCQVFVVEQNCPYLDVDNKDQKALHLVGYLDDQLVACCRIFDVDGYLSGGASIGRVIVAKDFRKLGLGHQLMAKALEIVRGRFGNVTVLISAQQYLKEFYGEYQFVQTGEMYLEDGIPHIRMKRIKSEKSLGD